MSREAMVHLQHTFITAFMNDSNNSGTFNNVSNVSSTFNPVSLSKYCQRGQTGNRLNWQVRRSSPINICQRGKQTMQCQVRRRHLTALIRYLLWVRQPHPDSPRFAVCISILARIHSAGILFQHISISQAICLLPQGLLSIGYILWSQQEITFNSVLLCVCVPSWKFISATMFFQYSESASIMDRSLSGLCVSHFTMTYGAAE